ncbi:MAG TPA: SDR family NAD(P)-dependent oxidoreductase [Bacteroidales bacterium]|nr:SDR family NAD(P)-dependent oxidoreductase [Bacteroidales bacterium]HRZ48565.1 SDR family NAD(P)-dependent oxidoreductase [Bacteroidales bacterium]
MKQNIRKYFKEYQWPDIMAMIRNNRSAPAICRERFNGKLVVITGATSGVGYVTAKKFAAQGANLLCINRNQEKSERLRQEIEADFGVKCDYRIADLSNLQDVFRVSEELRQWPAAIDVIIHNAGVYLTKRELTPEGFEKTFMVHYLASFVLTHRLMEKFKAQGSGRVILVGSEGHRFAVWGLDTDDLHWEKRRYSGLKSYGSAKTAQLLSMLIFNDQFEGTGVTINTMHPGEVKTDTGQENGRLYRWFKKHIFDKTLKPAEISADALYYLGVSDEVSQVSGKFFNLTTRENPAPPAADREVAKKLWKITLAMTGLDSETGFSGSESNTLQNTGK